jgi:hypothetical protein
MKTKKFEIIRCPKCDYEYLPSEIFVPKNFLGVPKNVERDFSGRILDYCGSSPDLFESYTCDNCNTTFRVTAKIGFSTEIDVVENFDEDYIVDTDKTDLFN